MRIRAEYRVGTELRFLATLDMMHLMERAMRRADIPYALSEGFNPHIKMSMGTVLPVGLWGEKEYLDVDLAMPITMEAFVQKMNDAMPPAAKILQCVEIAAGEPALMKTINTAQYCYIMQCAPADLGGIKDNILASQSIIIKSKGKKKDLDKDLRPGIFKIATDEYRDCSRLSIWAGVGEPVNVRYDELLELLVQMGIKRDIIIDVYRKASYIRCGGQFYSPLQKVSK